LRCCGNWRTFVILLKLLKMNIRTGFGVDVHAFAPDRPLVLGGVVIPSERGLAGHSDADVLTHAVCDALLGAARLGDIGAHFPDTDPQYSGIDSQLLLARVAAMLAEQGYRVGNVDCVLCLQAPKLRPYIDAMCAALADTLGVPACDVSVKATTTEHLGFTGREEGVAAFASALVYKE
jgi:2-C-methyl-D-erythritol 2,4-cyclodiphosphate synthase